MKFLKFGFLLLIWAFAVVVMFVDMPEWMYYATYATSFIAGCLYSYGTYSIEDRLTRLEKQSIQKEGMNNE